MVRTQTDVDYVGDRVVVEPIDVPLGTTYEQLLEMIYSVTDINKEHFRLILSCKYPMKKGNKFQPCPVKNDSGVARMLEMHNRFGMDEVELFVEQVPIDLQMNSPLEEDEEDEEGTQCDDDSVRAEDVHNDDNQDREDTEDLDDPIELSPMQYHLAPSPQFENVENIGHVVSSEWTPWGNTLMGHPTGEFIVGQIFNSKGDLQHAVKMYSINSHQEYIVLSSTKKLLVLRCKKAEQSQCPWRLRATVVKGTSLFEINKYSGPHTCVNPCMNQDHHQLDSNLIAAHIEGMIKTQFTLSVAAIQASVVERFGYHISYTKASKGKRKALTNLFGNMRNEEVFQRVFWAFHPSIEGFKHCRPVLTIDGTHLYGKYKGTKSSNSKEGSLCYLDRHPSIMVVFADVYLGWSEPNAYHRICRKIQHAYGDIGRIDQNALSWLEGIHFEKWALSHDGGRRYGIMTTNMSEVFNSVLKGARSFPITAFVQLTFYRLNSYFVVRREHDASRLASSEQYTPYVDAKINANVVKAGSHEVVLYDHFQGLFHVKASRGSKKTSSGGRTHRVNLLTLFYYDSIVMEHREGRFDPDPLDCSILALQDRHRSQLVDSGQLNQVLTCRQRLWTFMREWEMDPRIRRYVMQSGFYGVYRVGHISLDWPLITSLVERWRPETHTFHLPIGEMTVTLQDVAMILGLPRWLREQFSYPPAGVDDVILQRYARAFILALLGGAWFADKTGTHVQLCYLPLLRDFTEISHYSWGSAVLAYLYGELCRASLDSATEISGPITLLQLWSWERLHVGRPDFDRPPMPIVVPHVHDDVVDGLHDHLLPDEPLPIHPLGHRSIGCPDTGSGIMGTIYSRFDCTSSGYMSGEDHRVHSTHEPSTSSGSSMRPPSLITPVRVPPIRAIYIIRLPLSPPDVSIPAYSPRPETTIPSTLTPVQPSISLDAPPPIAESFAPPPIIESIAPPPVTESVAPLPFLQGTAHAARLHVRVPRGHRAPRVRRVLPPSVPSISTTHVDDVS
ncbi:Serine/threonine-protein phosphatase 7 long form-like [Vitis vinifera]|uniref:Serine/threonine-protein phosphatase 7 long form-like n=1 Tax=Vitis vinifera TaxID=29760 RepID=A0A438F0P8_VITVI|nr:Serine/threonine-protein phosphatase 7 long form-like [Vitis vinifera]